jgi:hypothetical protein
MAVPHKRYPDIAEGGCYRGMGLVYRDPHGSYGRKGGEHGVSGPAGSSLDQTKALGTKRFAHAIDDFVVRNGIDHFVGARGSRKVDFKVKIDDEGLPYLGFMRHHAVIGVKS